MHTGRRTRSARPRRYVDYTLSDIFHQLTHAQNIEKAKKEIARLEAEEDAANGSTDAARKPAQKDQAVNGSASPSAELAQEKDAAADATEDLKKASIEDNEATEA